MSYTIDDLNDAKCHLMMVWMEWENYRGSKPMEVLRRLKQARSHVQKIERDLKTNRVIPKTGHTRLFRELNHKYPEAKKDDQVDYMGKKFRRTFETSDPEDIPARAVNWGERWIEIEKKSRDRD